MAEEDGSETCHNTPNIPGKFHDNDPAGTLAEGGFEVLVDDQIMSLTNVNHLTSGQHSITIRQIEGTFMGLYMWANSDAALSESLTDSSMKGGNTWTVGKKDVECDAGSSALTHTGIEAKTQSSGILTIPMSGTLEVQLQPMTIFTGGSTFFWSSLLFEAASESPPELPTVSPTKSPANYPVAQSPTKPPARLPTQSPAMSPTKSPIMSPTKLPSSSPTSLQTPTGTIDVNNPSALRQPSISPAAVADNTSSSPYSDRNGSASAASSIWAQVGVGASVFFTGVLAKAYYF